MSDVDTSAEAVQEALYLLEEGEPNEVLRTQQRFIIALAAERDALRTQLAAIKGRLPWRMKDLERGLILFRTSSNAHDCINCQAKSEKIDNLPQVGRDELASIMTNMAIGYSRDKVKANGVVQQWLAEARDSALEEAASVVDSHRDEFAGHHSKSFAQGCETQAIGCAGAIRSLKTQTQET